MDKVLSRAHSFSGSSPSGQQDGTAAGTRPGGGGGGGGKKRRSGKAIYIPHKDKPAPVVDRRNARERRRVEAVSGAGWDGGRRRVEAVSGAGSSWVGLGGDDEVDRVYRAKGLTYPSFSRHWAGDDQVARKPAKIPFRSGCGKSTSFCIKNAWELGGTRPISFPELRLCERAAAAGQTERAVEGEAARARCRGGREARGRSARGGAGREAGPTPLPATPNYVGAPNCALHFCGEILVLLEFAPSPALVLGPLTSMHCRVRSDFSSPISGCVAFSELTRFRFPVGCR